VRPSVIAPSIMPSSLQKNWKGAKLPPKNSAAQRVGAGRLMQFSKSKKCFTVNLPL
jgi:hypothetical protein